MSDSNVPSHEQITRRAYEIFVERGRPEGCDLEHWLEAEKQLRTGGQSKSTAPVATAPGVTSATPTPIRATQPAAASNGRSAGNGRTPSPRPAARK